jgi:hypothetical protein
MATNWLITACWESPSSFTRGESHYQAFKGGQDDAVLKYLGRRRCQLRALPAGEWKLLAAFALLLPLIALALRVLGPARVRAALLRWTPGTSVRVDVSRAQEMGALVNVAGRRLPFAPSCLVKSLLLECALLRQGIACRLQIGIRIEAHAFLAHAWVECDGIPANDQADVANRFAAFEGPVWTAAPGA